MNRKANNLWTLMVSVLITPFSVGCGPADDPGASDSQEEEAVDDDDNEQNDAAKIVSIEVDSQNGFAWIVDDKEPHVIGGGTMDTTLEAETVVYLCLPPGDTGDFTKGDKTSPPPACSTTPCYGLELPYPVDDTFTCLEAAPVADNN